MRRTIRKRHRKVAARRAGTRDRATALPIVAAWMLGTVPGVTAGPLSAQETACERSALEVLTRGITWGSWVPPCALDLGQTDLALVPWTERFTGPEAPPLYFRDGERHALLEAASDGDRIGDIDSRDQVEILSLAGDWARVRVYRPSRQTATCQGVAWTGEELRGWLRWREPERGPLLWYPTRGS